jgi:hypothetical protein
MSFIAALFAMDIKQFHSSNDGLDLGMVLAIICENLKCSFFQVSSLTRDTVPVSAVIIFPLSAIAFNVEKVEGWWDGLIHAQCKRKKRIDNPA